MNDGMITKLNTQLQEIDSNLDHVELIQTSISSVSVGWHMEHSMLVMNAVFDVLAKSDPQLFKRKFNLQKTIIFTLGKIPRGRGKAPKVVTPIEQQDRIQTHKQLEKTKLALAEITNLDKGVFFKHPLFGHLRLRDAIRFLEIHTEHHLRIVRDIVGKDRTEREGE